MAPRPSLPRLQWRADILGEGCRSHTLSCSTTQGGLRRPSCVASERSYCRHGRSDFLPDGDGLSSTRRRVPRSTRSTCAACGRSPASPPDHQTVGVRRGVGESHRADPFRARQQTRVLMGHSTGGLRFCDPVGALPSERVGRSDLGSAWLEMQSMASGAGRWPLIGLSRRTAYVEGPHGRRGPHGRSLAGRLLGPADPEELSPEIRRLSNLTHRPVEAPTGARLVTGSDHGGHETVEGHCAE